MHDRLTQISGQRRIHPRPQYITMYIFLYSMTQQLTIIIFKIIYNAIHHCITCQVDKEVKENGICTITSSLPSDHKFCHVFAFLIFLPLLIPLCNYLSFSLVWNSWLSQTGLNHTYHPILLCESVKNMIKTSLLSNSSCGVPQNSVLGPLPFVTCIYFSYQPLYY